MATKTRICCNQCDQLEDRCECEKYCILCQGQTNVRLCEDGLYYCDSCREAAGYEVSS